MRVEAAQRLLRDLRDDDDDDLDDGIPEPELEIPGDVDGGLEDPHSDDDDSDGYCTSCGETFDPEDIDSDGFCTECQDNDATREYNRGWELRRLNAIRGGWEHR
jgi:hypothetical protein